MNFQIGQCSLVIDHEGFMVRIDHEKFRAVLTGYMVKKELTNEPAALRDIDFKLTIKDGKEDAT